MVLETQRWVGLAPEDVERAGVCTMNDLFSLGWPEGVEFIDVYDGEMGNVEFGIGVIYDPPKEQLPEGVAAPTDDEVYRKASKLMEAAIYRAAPGPWAAPLFANMMPHETDFYVGPPEPTSVM